MSKKVQKKVTAMKPAKKVPATLAGKSSKVTRIIQKAIPMPRLKFKSKAIESPSPIDVHVGSRIRLRRAMLGLTQEKLADGVGVTFQQVQKYEKGTNRVSASRLFDFSKALDVPISFFFDQIKGGVTEYKLAEEAQGYDAGPSIDKKESLDLLRNFHRITEPKVRKKILDLVKSLSDGE